MADQQKGTGEAGWSEAEKSPDPTGQADRTPAGEAEPKGRPTSDREATETAAARTTPNAGKPRRSAAGASPRQG